MNPPSLYSRLTPTTRTPDSGVVRIASEGRASRAVARALGQLIERLVAIGPDGNGVVGGLEGVDAANPLLTSVRDALRQLAARSREGALLCRVVERTLILEGVPIDRRTEAEDPLLGRLLQRLIALEVGSLTVREGAASGELLTLARLLAQPRVPDSVRTMGTPSRGIPIAGGDTPATVSAVAFTDETPRELLRTWSVLVTPIMKARSGAQTAEEADLGAGVAVGGVLSRLAAARTDDAATTAVSALRELLDVAQRRGDAVAIERVAIGVMRQLQVVGDQGGRLALERAVRLLLQAPPLRLLSTQLPQSVERLLLVQLFARAGDAGVATLMQQLLSTEDALSRRAYFDSIVAMDVGSSQLFGALTDSRWFVVRNAAALLGEMGVEHADEVLIPLLQHADERIRIAVARALMRLRTAKALHALHGVIDDRLPELRRLAAAAFGLTGAGGGGGVRPPAARLSAALERETDEDVALEMLAALGRLGSADAVQRLLRIALPASSDMSGAVASGSRDSWIRIAALEALIRARGALMRPVLDVLRADADAEVAAAAEGLQGSLATNGTA
jgi:HEAT repeat protein